MAYVETALVSQAASYNLASLLAVKDELDIKAYDKSQDVWLLRAIGQASALVQSNCAPRFAVEGWQETIRPDRGMECDGLARRRPIVQLARYPAVAISSVTASPGMGTTTLTEGSDFSVNKECGHLLRLDPINGGPLPWSVAKLTVQYVAGFGAIATEQCSISGSTPVVFANSGTFSLDQGVSDTNGVAFTRVAGSPASLQYRVDVSSGQYTFASADTGKSVNVSYAFNIIPDNVVEAVLRLVVQRFRQKGRDPALMERNSPTLGQQRWWVGTTPGQNGAMPPEIEGLLVPYLMGDLV